jgi:hypothetical protein
MMGLFLCSCATPWEQAKINKYNEGYDRGTSDTAKTSYWITQNLQKTQEGDQAKPQTWLYTFPASETQPYPVTVRVEE